MKFTKKFRGTDKKLHRTEYKLVNPTLAHVWPKLDFLSSTSVWHIDEYIKKKTKDWMHLLNEDGYSGKREDVMSEDYSVYTGTYSVFPAPLMELIIARYGERGQTVLDAFAGGPPRGYVSGVMGLEYLGVDLSKKQVKQNRKLMKKLELKDTVKYKVGDARNIEDMFQSHSFDLGVTCPPYFNLEVYSDDPDDLSRSETYSDFDTSIFWVACGYAKVLRPGSFMCIVVANFRDKKTKALHDFRGNTVANFMEAGFNFHQDIILVKNFGSAATRAANSWRGRKLVPRHEHLLIFQLPEKKSKKRSKL